MSKAFNNVAKLRGIVDVTEPQFGASTSATSAQNLAAINAAIAAAYADGGGQVLIPDLFTVSAAPTMLSGVELVGKGYHTGIYNEDTSNSWDAAGLIFGNYGTASASAIGTNIPSIYAETKYSVGAISAGAYTVTCSTASDAGNFAAGDLVHIGSADMSSTGYEKFQMLNEVISSDSGTGVVTLKHKIADAMGVKTTEGELYFSSAANQFTAGRTLTGGTSGTTAVILGVFMGSNLKMVGVNTISGSGFVAGETVTESTSGYTAVIATGGVQLNPMIRKLNTGNVTGLDDNPAKVLVRSAIRNMRVEQAKTSGSAYQAIHFAAYDCDFDVWVKGIDGFGGNPLGFCRGEVRSEYRRVGAELAYCVDHNDMKFRLTRLADYATAFQGAFLTSEDGGQDNNFDVEVTNEYGTVSTQAAIGIYKRRTQLTGRVNGSIGAGVSVTNGADFSTVTGMHITNPGTNGISCTVDSCEIGGNVITGVPSGSRGIRMTNTSAYCTIHDNVIGDRASPQTQDTILDDNGETTTNIYSNNVSKISQPRRCEPQATTYQTAAETTLETYSIEANTAVVGMAWEVEWFGSITGTNGQKDIRIKVGPSGTETTIATQTMAAGTTGAFYGRAVVVSQSASSWAARGIQDTAGTLAAITGSNGITNAFTNANNILLTAQLASASDTIALRYFSVKPLGDQFQ